MSEETLDDEARNHLLNKKRGWSLTINSDKPDRRVYDARPPKRHAYLCPACGERARIKERRWSGKNYVDLPLGKKRIELRVLSGRFTCTNKDCSQGAFTEKLEELDQRHHLTTDLKNTILNSLRRDGTFSQVARQYHLNEQTLRNLEAEFVQDEDKRRIEEHTLRLPERLGMHTCRLAGRTCCLLTDIDTESVFELVRSQQPQQIEYQLKKLFDPVEYGRVVLISVPLKLELRAVANDLFPRAKIFVPRNEIQALANEHLTALMRIVCNRSRFERTKTLDLIESVCATRITRDRERALARVLKTNPRLKHAYEAKQRLLEAYSLDNRDEMGERFVSWRETVSTLASRKEVGQLLRIEDWQDAIIEGMIVPYTDYFEKIQDLIAALVKAGRGYSPERIRGRLLYGEGIGSTAPITKRARLDSEPPLFDDDAIVRERVPSLQRLIDHFTEWTANLSPKNT